jgi:hypothetical protein
MTEPKKQLRRIAPSFVVPGPCGVSVGDRLKELTEQDEKVLRLTGEHLRSLASKDLKTRCAEGASTTAVSRSLTAVDH